jgi:23S rRNA pseudouridine955/2504/2580 synthase
MKTIRVTSNESGQRIDRYLCKYMPRANKNFLNKMLRKKRIKVNKKKTEPNYYLQEQDEIMIYFSEETIQKFRGEEKLPVGNFLKYDIEILYEDEDYLALNKPAGWLTQKSQKEDYAIVDWGKEYLYAKGKSYSGESTFSPACCNRLDRNTSGIVLMAKNYRALKDINEKIRNKKIYKEYTTLVKGVLKGTKKLESYLIKNEADNKVTLVLDREDAKEISLVYETTKILRDASLLKINLITGRSHQIRVQLAEAGHPVIGDNKYGDRKANNGFYKKYGVNRQLLHAAKMIIPSADKEDIIISCPLPADFKKVMKGLSE